MMNTTPTQPTPAVTVWYDNDRDGIYEPEGPDGVAGTGDDELGVEGVVARLFKGDGTAYVAPGATAQYTTTTKFYRFLGRRIANPATPETRISYD